MKKEKKEGDTEDQQGMEMESHAASLTHVTLRRRRHEEEME